MLAPLDHQGRTAALAFLVGGLLHPLDVLHMLFGIFEIFGEPFVEFAQRVSPLLFAFFDLVELFLESRRVFDIENIAGSFPRADR